ncbi:MAG: F0F1 ATP synthase subunit B [Rhodothermales bacterium]|nr:F0F1 ATP synthase subunit B [Rhodothermales bacterium]
MPAALMVWMQATAEAAQEAAQAAPEAAPPSLLQPNVGLVIFTALVFGVVLWILYKYAWGPITTALEEREHNIEASINRAESALAEAKQIQEDNARARREAEQEAQRLLREAREEAERLRAEEVQKTREQIGHLREQAQAEIEREKESALGELRAEVADLAIRAAEKILEENLDAQRQRRLVENFIDDLPKN